MSEQQTVVKQAPTYSVRSGRVKGSTWRNVKDYQGKEVEFFSHKIVCAFKVGEEWKESNNFNTSDLMDLMAVAQALHRNRKLVEN